MNPTNPIAGGQVAEPPACQTVMVYFVTVTWNEYGKLPIPHRYWSLAPFSVTRHTRQGHDNGGCRYELPAGFSVGANPDGPVVLCDRGHVCRLTQSMGGLLMLVAASGRGHVLRMIVTEQPSPAS